jgi:DNA-binding MarR family transcriptional regulator
VPELAVGRRRSAPALDYRALADLRYQIRRFLHLRETAARAAGIAPQQYLLLLQLKGLQGRDAATIGMLAERLQIRHHSTVGLVDRLVRQGLVRRRRSEGDRRQVVVEIRRRGEILLRQLALSSMRELQVEGPELIALLQRLARNNNGVHTGGGER